MDTAIGLAAMTLLLGYGTRHWRTAVQERLAERREDRALRRKYDL